MSSSVFDRAKVQHLCARGGEFQHFFVGDRVDSMGRWNDSRIGGEHAIHVGINLTNFGVQRGGQRHRRGVAAPTSESRNVFGIAVEPLEARDNCNRAFVQCIPNAIGCHINNSCGAVLGGRHHPRLAAGVRPRFVTKALDGHRQQRHRDSLARREQHVEFTRIRSVGDLTSQID